MGLILVLFQRLLHRLIHYAKHLAENRKHWYAQQMPAASASRMVLMVDSLPSICKSHFRRLVAKFKEDKKLFLTQQVGSNESGILNTDMSHTIANRYID